MSQLLQNTRTMCCRRLYEYKMPRIVYFSSFNTSFSMKLDQKLEKDQRSGLICAKLKRGSHRGFFSIFAASVSHLTFPSLKDPPRPRPKKVRKLKKMKRKCTRNRNFSKGIVKETYILQRDD